MAITDGTFAQWLMQANVAAERLTVEQTTVLQAAFHYRQQVGTDCYSTRLLSHFLLHCNCGVPVAQIARLLAISRPTASRQQGRASKEVIQSAHHRMAGRPHVKLLPRYAGPIAEFVLSHADASRFDTLAFIAHLGRACFDRGTAPFPEEIRPESRQPRRRPRQHQRGGSGRTGHVATSAWRSCRTAGGTTASPADIITGAPLFAASTHYAGAFLLMPQALGWLQTAQACFSDDYGSLERGLLTSVFALVTGLARIFHLDEMDDSGFALLTGGRNCPTRQLVGAWRRHLPWHEVDAFCRRTFPWHLIEHQDALVSYDEHSLPRWTRKFQKKTVWC